MRVLVTGCASGIGAASARRLKRDGAEIVGLDIAEGADTADSYLRCDLSDPAAIDALDIPGEFDALLNIAGLPPRPGTEAQVLAVNVFGLIRLSERVIPKIRTGGAIVSLASKAGAHWQTNIDQVLRLLDLPGPSALPDFVAAEAIDPVRSYDLSKEAVIVWTKLQTERLQGLDLRANTVSPAAIETPILKDFEDAFGERAHRGTRLMGRPGTPDEVAEVVAFLARPDSGWIKGQDIAVEGGLAARVFAEEVADRRAKG